MRENLLQFLCCPICHSTMSLTSALLPIIGKKLQDGDTWITEGTIECNCCGSRHVVLAGVPIIVENLSDYLSSRKHELVGIIAEYGVSDRCRQLILSAKETLYGTSNRQESWESRSGLEMYLRLHYGKGSFSHDERLAKLLQPQRSFYDIVHEFVRAHVSSELDLVVDLGCNVGGHLYRFASNAKLAIGFDYSFAAAKIASDLLVEKNGAAERYVGSSPGCLPAFDHERDCCSVHVCVSDIRKLPLVDRSASLVMLSNVLDITTSPAEVILSAIRITNAEGYLSTVSPYYWRSDRTPPSKWLVGQNVSNTAYLRSYLTKLNLQVLAEADDVPWILRVYDRGYQIWFCHCLVMHKAGANNDSHKEVSDNEEC